MTGLVIAMEAEAKPFLTLLKKKKEFLLSGKKCYRGEIFGEKVCMIVCDIGKVNAASATQAIIMKFKSIDKIINIGVTGAVKRGLLICDICAVERAIQYDFDVTSIDDVPVGYIQTVKSDFIYSDKKLFEQFNKIFNKSITVATADRFSASEKEAEFIRSLGGDVRDMELGAIAQTAYMNNIPFAAIKSISDTCEGDPSNDFKENLRRSTECFLNYAEKIFECLRECL